MWVFHQKIKRVFATLNNLSNFEFGDIHAKVKEYKEISTQVEERLINDILEENRTNLHPIIAEYIGYLRLEEYIFKQKTQLHEFQECYANSSYFHALTRGRRRILHIHNIQNEDGNWVQGEDQIAKAACDYFQDYIHW